MDICEFTPEEVIHGQAWFFIWFVYSGTISLGIFHGWGNGNFR